MRQMSIVIRGAYLFHLLVVRQLGSLPSVKFISEKKMQATHDFCVMLNQYLEQQYGGEERRDG